MLTTTIYLVAGFIFIWWILLTLIWKTIRGVQVHWIPKWTNHQIDLVNTFGSWAVVTGATDGIGRAYAMELAKRGVNIVLISRMKSKLESTAVEIAKMYNVKTKIIQADFSQGFSVYEHIEMELKEIPVGILVNNVGMFFTHPLYFAEVPPRMIDAIVNVNVNSALLMTRIVLPAMQQRGKGAIVFVSSITELSSTPLNTLYSSTKRFIKSFCEGLEPDCQKYGIVVQRLTPSFIQTKLSAFTESTLGTSDLVVPRAGIYAKHAVNTLGRINVTTGYWPHSLQYLLVCIIPRALFIHTGDMFALRFQKEYFRKQKLGIVQEESSANILCK